MLVSEMVRKKALSFLKRTTPPEPRMAAWEQRTCENCGGYGVTEAWGGGPTECFVCGGSGFYFVSPGGRVADYPGGPFRGSVARNAGTPDG